MRCKSANQAWAARWGRRRLVDEGGVNINHLLVTTMDSDTVWHPDTFAALTVLFATDARRYATFWQAPIRYHGNVWSTPAAAHSACLFVGLGAGLSGGAVVARAAHVVYSMSMRLLDSAGYWDSNVIADEWHMYIKTHFQRGEDLHLQPVFLPFHAHATTAARCRKPSASAISRRCAMLGAKEIGYTIGQIASHPEVPLRHGLSLLVRVAHDNILGGLGWLVMLLARSFPSAAPAPHAAACVVRAVRAAPDLGDGGDAAHGCVLAARPAQPARAARAVDLARAVGRVGRACPLLAIMTFACVALAGAARADPTAVGHPAGVSRGAQGMNVVTFTKSGAGILTKSVLVLRLARIDIERKSMIVFAIALTSTMMTTTTTGTTMMGTIVPVAPAVGARSGVASQPDDLKAWSSNRPHAFVFGPIADTVFRQR